MRKSCIKKIGVYFIVLFIIFLVIIKLDNKNNVENNAGNQNNETAEIHGDVQKPNNVVNIEIDKDNLIYSVAVLDNFDDGKKLSTEQYLQVVYNAISNKYIDFDDKIENNQIPEQLVNSLVYKIFGVELQENISINGMEYADRVYKISPKRSGYIYLIQNKTIDSAAGTSYESFDLYKEYASGSEQYMGRYTVSTVQNTVTGETYIKSLRRD